MKRLVCTLMFALLAPISKAQNNPPGLIPDPPVFPVIVQTRFWPEQFVQWVDKDMPYFMVEAYADSSLAKPVFDVVLVERGTYKQTHYVNNSKLAEQITQLGEKVEVATVSLKKNTDDNNSPTFEFTVPRLKDPPILWRYIQGSEITEQGAGLTPHPSSTAVVFMYREEGAVAAQGTALQIGSNVSEASLWKDISQPPYFVAYHGANTRGLDVMALLPGSVTRSLARTPAQLKTGESWQFKDDSGTQTTTITIDGISGDLFQLSQHTEGQPADIEATAKQSGHGWLIQSLRYRPNKGGLVLTFSPGLPVNLPVEHTNLKFELQGGKEKRIATGTIEVNPAAEATAYLWEFKSPSDWLKGTSLKYVVASKNEKTTLTGEVHQ